MRTTVLTALLIVGVLGGSATAASTDMCDDPPCTKTEIQAYQRRVSKHLMRAQQERFTASARGEAKKAQRYDKEFKRTQKRMNEASHALQTASE